ncbi:MULTISPECIES: cytochrome P450 [unclassified Streptomyces]|uniref:cytochrome P450 n=1 Tax=Streptomyces TaxID=1883 RepID=UPI000B511577|nr:MULTISPECIES: cytochrome P450 [unclassified Streptomyces]MYX00752.1 cytochrome P450 [Streptomyces sp. SID8378]SNB90461.1 pentalenene oxygenase [Streptomyces sp. PgraA7]
MIPLAPGALPLAGHAHSIIRNPLAFLRTLAPHGDVVKVRLGPVTVLVLCDPVLVRQALLNDRLFDKGGPTYERAREFLGDSLSTCPHSSHRQQRRHLQPAFHASKLPHYTRTMTDQIAVVTRAWRDGQSIDVMAETKKITVRVLTRSLFGTDLSDQEIEQISRGIDDITAGMHARMFLPAPLDRLPTPRNVRYYRANTTIRGIVQRLIDEGRRAPTGGSGPETLLDILTADNWADGPLSDADILNQAVSFLLAGMETTAEAMAWALCLAVQHPEVLARLRTETAEVLGGRPAQGEHLPDLKLTASIVNETLRMYPGLWITTRVATADTQLGNHLIASGTHLLISPYLLHHRSDIYPDPDRFDPDRWTSPGLSRPRDAFIPFMAGARKCMAADFAVTEVVLTLATLVDSWEFTAPLQRPQAAAAATLRPKDLHMRITRREH